jgi:hypothetical protein
LCSLKYQTASGAYPPVQRVPEAPSCKIKRPRREAKHSPLLSALVNTLNAKLNPICHLLAILGAHHILHVSRIRVKNDWSYTVTPPSLLSVSREGTDFTFSM